MSTATYDTTPHPTAPRSRARYHGRRGQPGAAPGDFAPRIYRGRNVEELIPRIVAELGEDAVVIRHHHGLTGGFAGFFQRSFVEIEARRGAPGIDRYDEDDAAPVLPEDAAGTLPQYDAPPPDAFEDVRAPVERAPEQLEEPMQVWATNPFAAALAEAEAAVRAAEPAVPPDLDAALAEALAEAEDAQAPDEVLDPASPDLFAAPPAESPAPPAAIDDAEAEARDPEAAAEDPEATAPAEVEDADAPDPGSIAALAQLLAEVAPDRVVLALPATLGATPVAQLLQALRPLGANALAVIHADETDQLGVAVQAACAFESTPVYVLARADRNDADGGPRAWALSSIDPCRLLDRPLAPR
jgi:hypothetical protein